MVGTYQGYHKVYLIRVPVGPKYYDNDKYQIGDIIVANVATITIKETALPTQ